MADYVSRLTLDTSEHNAALQGATEKVGKYAKQTDDATKSIDGMQKTTSRSTKELLAQMSQMENVSRSTSGYKKQLGQLSQQIADLTINYRAMSEEQKGSAFGQEVAAKIQELTQKAADYKDAIVDAQAEVNALASDTANWDSISSAISVTSSALQSFVATGALGEQTSEALIAVLAKLKAMETMTSAAIKIGNALQKQSALMLGVKRVQTLAATAATKAQANATVVATAKQRILNAVAKANPYVLLASAIIAVTAAIATFVIASNKSAKAQQEAAEEAKKQAEAQKENAGKVGAAVGDVVAHYRVMQTEWQSLSSAQEKREWLEKNKQGFEQLGLSVGDVNTADAVFITQSEAVINALKARAKATAMQEVYIEQLKEAYKNAAELAKNPIRVDAKSAVNERVRAAAGVTRDDENWGTYSDQFGTHQFYNGLTESGVAKVNAYYERLAQDASATALQESEALIERTYGKMWIEAEAEAKAAEAKIKKYLAKPTSDKKGGSNSNAHDDKQDIYDPASLRAAERAVADLKDKLSRVDVNSEQFTEIARQLKVAEGLVREINDKLKDKEVLTLPQQLVLEYDAVKKKIDEITKQYKIGAIDKESALSAIGELNNQLTSKGLNKIEVELDPKVDDGKVQEVATSIGDIIGGAQSATNAVIGLGNSIKGMVENAEEMDAWDWFTSIMGFIWQLVDAFQAVNTMIEMFKTVQLAAGAASMTAATQEAGAAAVTATAASTEATANTAAAITGATKSGAKLPFPINLIAIAAGVAAVIGAIALIGSISGKFATGGIVGGGSYTGDTTLIRANAGEAVLNQRQQSHLFNILNGQSSNETISGGQVEFKIRGNELVGVLNNYSKKHNKV